MPLNHFVRFQKFLAVGGVGFLVNSAFLYFLTDVVHLFYVASSPLAIEISMLVTFVLNESWTWRDRKDGARWGRAWRYQVINFTGLFINVAVLYALTEGLGFHYIGSNILGAAMAAVWNYSVNHAVTWRPSESKG